MNRVNGEGGRELDEWVGRYKMDGGRKCRREEGRMDGRKGEQEEEKGKVSEPMNLPVWPGTQAFLPFCRLKSSIFFF